MTKVRIIRDYDNPGLLRQTPGCRGVWGGVEFTLEPVEECDYAIVLNGTSTSTTVCCPPSHVWSIIQEPCTEFRVPWHDNPDYSHCTFTTDPARSSPAHVQSQAALPWHVQRDYDSLVACSPSPKTHILSWITSDLRVLQGHRARMDFLTAIKSRLEFDLWGRGFTPLDDKWDGLAPYRYSLAIENHESPLYWTEKIADCYLAWTMPIYFGCTRITDYFPAESLIQIDIRDPDAALERIRAAIERDAWRRNLDAIAAARDLVLNRYQLFPFVTSQIRQSAALRGDRAARQRMTIHPRETYFKASETGPAISQDRKTLAGRFRQMLGKLRG